VAFRSSYGSKSNPGIWINVGYDHELNVQPQLRITRLSDEMREAAEQKYGVLKRDKRTGVRSLVIPDDPDTRRAVGYFYAFRMWTETKNVYIKCENEEAAELYGKELGKKVEIGESVCIDGNLSDNIKNAILKDDLGLVRLINDRGVDVEEEEAVKAGELAKN
jgi:hypothetical protein